MKCPVCDTPDKLVVSGYVPFRAPLAKKGGGIRAAGVKVTQSDIKAAWQLEQLTYDDDGNVEEEEPESRVLRGPIKCTECSADLVMISKEGGSTLYEMDMEEVLEIGVENF